ncbi:MAG: hypothetical protein R3A44_30195 [Caldilineaceae bacterium]
MKQSYDIQRVLFVQFLRQGLHHQIIPGEFTYDQILNKYNIPHPSEPVIRGFSYTWFRDLYFHFDDDALLASIGIRIKPSTSEIEKLPRALDFQWLDFAGQLTPETFEQLVIDEHIPCLKATQILDEEIYPPIYCLDHLGLMPHFEDEGHYNLDSINICLVRDFPRLSYSTIWPKYDPPMMFDWPNFINHSSIK